MVVIHSLRRLSVTVGFALSLTCCVTWAAHPPLEWSANIKPGLSESELKSELNNLGIQYREAAGGLTYSSKLVTKERDYLFCQDRLYAIVEGGFTTGREFNEWFQAFLTAHRRYGEPAEYYAEEDWGRFRAKWHLSKGSTLHFQLQSNLKDKQGWSRQLYADRVGKPCM